MRAVFAVFMLAQGWIATAPLAEYRGVGMASHVEAPETRGHFTHDESTCVACSLIALHAIAPEQLPFEIETERLTASLPIYPVSAGALVVPERRSRAPPALS